MTEKTPCVPTAAWNNMIAFETSLYLENLHKLLSWIDLKKSKGGFRGKRNNKFGTVKGLVKK